MSENPCQKEKDEEYKAMEEWVDAVNFYKNFVPTEPLDKDRDRLSIEESEQVFQAGDALDKAFKKYFDALRASDDCKKQHP